MDFLTIFDIFFYFWGSLRIFGFFKIFLDFKFFFGFLKDILDFYFFFLSFLAFFKYFFWIFYNFFFSIFFSRFFGFLSKFLRLLLKVTKVTTGQQKLPRMGQNSIISFLFAWRANKASAEGWSPAQELEVGPRSGPYLLVKII